MFYRCFKNISNGKLSNKSFFETVNAVTHFFVWNALSFLLFKTRKYYQKYFRILSRFH